MKSIFHSRWVNHINGWLLVLPAFFMIALFTHYPISATIYHSFFSAATATRPSSFIGLENYLYLLEDDIFWKVLGNNLLYSMCTVPMSIALALAMALLINRNIAGRSWTGWEILIPLSTVLL